MHRMKSPEKLLLMTQAVQPISDPIDEHHHQHRLRQHRPILRPPERYRPTLSISPCKQEDYYRNAQRLRKQYMHKNHIPRILSDLQHDGRHSGRLGSVRSHPMTTSVPTVTGT